MVWDKTKSWQNDKKWNRNNRNEKCSTKPETKELLCFKEEHEPFISVDIVQVWWTVEESIATTERNESWPVLQKHDWRERNKNKSVLVVMCSYEDNMEHKKQITPRRRRVGFPPITPNACVKDSVASGAFDSVWCEVSSL